MLLNNKHYYNLPPQERKNLWKHYKKVYPNMGYTDMVKHFNDEVENYQFGGRTDYFNSDVKKFADGGTDKNNTTNSIYEIAYGKPQLVITPEEKRKAVNPTYEEQKEAYLSDLKRRGSGRLEESISPLDFIGPNQVKAAANLVKSTAKTLPKAATKAGKYLTEKTPLKETWRLNPKAYQYNLPKDAMWRGLGKEGMEDALESGLFRAKQNIIPEYYPGTKLQINKSFGENPYFTPKFNTAASYGDNFIAEVPKDVTNWRNRYGRGKTWSQVADRPIPIDQGRILQKDWLRGYKEVPKPMTRTLPPSQQMGFINTKGAFQKYPKGKLTEEEIDAFKNSDFYKQATKEHLELKNKYGDSWKLPNYAEESLQKAIETGNRNEINKVLYGGRNWGASDYVIAGLAGTAYPGYAGIMGLALSPPAVKNKILNAAGITSKPGVLSSRDTTINITNKPMDFAKVNQTADGQMILGGEFIEGTNNTVRKAKDWLTATDTYSDKEYPSKDIQSFYGIENGKFKVGKASDFKSNTEIVPRRFGASNISQAILNEGAMRLLDKKGNPIYQNTPNTGKFILYSPSTKESEFNYITSGKSGVDKVNKFLKKNKDAQYIHLDNGRYEFYGLNTEGLSDQDFRDYYQQDLEREGNPGYNIILKRNGGLVK